MSQKAKLKSSRKKPLKRWNFLSQSSRARRALFLVLFAIIGGTAVYISQAAVGDPIACPLRPAVGIGSDYKTQRRPNHEGIDIFVGTGTPVYAAQSGIAIANPTHDPEGWGTYILLRGQTADFLYAHLSRITKTGSVQAGERIGFSGSTGGVSGPHLHFEMWHRNGAIGTSHINPKPSYSNCGGGSTAPPPDTPPAGGSTRPPSPPSVIQRDCHKQILSKSRGSKGPCVEHLQYHLMNKGYSPQLDFDIDNPNKRPDGVFGPKTEDAVKYFQYLNGKTSSGCPAFIPNASDRATRHRACDGIVGPKTWYELHLGIPDSEFYAVHATGPVTVYGIGGGSGRNDEVSPPPVITKPPQPGTPGTPGASIGQGRGGTGGTGGTATGPNTVGGNGGNGGSGTCIGGCKPGQPGTSNPGTPGASNPGSATQGSSGAPGAPGARGTSGTSGGQGTQGTKGSSGSVNIGGQAYDCEPGKKCTVKTSSSSTSNNNTSAKTASSASAGAQYVVRSHASGRCMDADGTKSGKDTQIWDCHGGTNQRWGFAKDGTIRLQASGLCLEVEGGDTDNGSDVQIYDCNGGSHQRWQWNKNGTIQSSATGKCLDVKDNKIDNGTNLQIWDCVGGANQKWGTW